MYGPLPRQWNWQTGSGIAATPTVASGTVYVGSWDGYEYAYDEASGALRWRTNLGRTSGNCGDPSPWTIGVTSAATLQGGLAYLGGGDSNWYALNASSGSVLWTVPTGDNSLTGGHYNWATPLLYSGHAYIGISSLCDSPLVQGELLRVNLGSHQIENVWKAVPDGQVGGTIWTTPVVDVARNTVFVTTGTRIDPTQPYAEAMVALDATTLTVKGAWQLPQSYVGDMDWGTSPTLFTDSGGRALVAGINKNGILYAFQRDNVGAGPVWQRQIAEGGGCPQCGDASASNGVFDGQRLYFAGGRTTIGGTAYGGSVRAINPANGQVLWERGLPAAVVGALTGANGMIVVPDWTGLYVVDATSGAVLYANDLGSDIFAQATVADGRLFLGDVNGDFHVFTFPTSPGAAVQAETRDPGTAARLRLHAAAGRPTAIGCARASESLAVASDCRLGVAPRCVRVGPTPTTAGPFAIRGMTVRETGRGRHPPAAVRFYVNGSCSGRPALRVRLVGGRTILRLRHALVVPRGTIVSSAASRPLRLRVEVRLDRSARTGTHGHLQ